MKYGMEDTVKDQWLTWINNTGLAMERLGDQAAALPEWPLADRWLLRALKGQVTEALHAANRALDELRERVEQ